MDIFESIWIQFSKRVYSCEELSDILKMCGYSPRDISEIICEAINQKKLGVVTFKKVRRKPPKHSLIVIK